MKRLALVLMLCALGASADNSDVIPLQKPVPGSQTGQTRDTFPLKTKPPAPAETVTSEVPSPNKPYVASIDVFGSPRLNESVVREALGKDLDIWLAKGLNNDPSAVQDEKKLRDTLKAKFNLPFVEWSVVQFFQPGDLAIHVTLDVVETADLARRMPFEAEPSGTFADPDHLIKDWMNYERIALELVEKGELEPDAENCVAYHCPFGHKHPKLKKFERIFVQGVKKNEKALAQIQSQDKRPEFRGAACYLLAYLKDGNKVVSYELTRLKDPQELVRNNGLRVLGDIAELHPEFIIPTRMVLPALHFPRVSDRSKSLYVVFQLATNVREAREEIVQNAVPDLLALLDSKQPDATDLSHSILRKISGKDFAATDIAAWKNWYNKLPGRALTQK